MNLQEAVAKAREMPDNMVLVAKPPLVWASEARYVADGWVWRSVAGRR
jgi:hypothetical protein